MVAITVATNVTIRTGAQGLPGVPGSAAPHAEDHEAGGSDEVIIEDLATTAGTLGQVPTATASGTMVMATPAAVITAHSDLTGLTPGDAGHTDLQLRSEQDQPSGYAGLDAGTLLDGAQVPYGSASDTATEGNDSRVPTQGENDALVGTNGTPATGNPYVTDSDPRNSDARTPTAHTILSHDTVTTGAELTSLADGSDVDSLHIHGIADAHIASASNPHGTDLGNLGSGTLAELNAAVTDATLDTSSASRPPNGSASGDLGGSYPSPSVAALTTTTGPTSLTIGAVADGQTLVRSGSTIIGSTPAGSGDVVGPAGGVVDGEIALYDSTTGKLIKGSSTVLGDLVADADLIDSSAGAGDAGKPIKLDSGGVLDSTIAEPPGSIATHDTTVTAHSNLPVEALTTAGSNGQVPTSDGAGNLVMSTPAGAGDVTSPGSETAGRITKFTGSKAIAETAVTETELDTLTDGSDADALHVHALADTHIADTANPHGTDVGNLGSGTLAELNTAITDATLDDSSDPRTPTAHASTHSDGGSDEVNIEDLASTGTDGQVVMADGAGGLELSNALIQNAKTGLVDVMTNLLSINAGDPAKIDVRASQGVVINFDPDPTAPTRVPLSWSVPFEAITLPGLAANIATSVYVVDGGGGTPVIELINAFPTSQDLRTKILIGFAFHGGATIVDAVDSGGVTAWDTGSSLDDLMSAFGDFNLSGNVYSANGANLLLNKSIGMSFGRGINASDINNQHRLANPLQSAIAFYVYSFQDGGSGFSTSNELTIDPDNYDDGSGTLATTSNKYTIQRLVFTPRAGGLTAVEYGQKLYNSLNDAIDGIFENGISKNPDLTPAILRGWLIVQGGATDLSNTSDAAFREKITEVAQSSGAGTDVNAIHVDGSNEISGITVKTTPVAADILVIEDSAAGNIKKSVPFSSLDARYAELSGAAFTGAITTTSTFDGRDVDADGTAQDTHIADTANPHGTDIENLGSGTLAELNAAVTDATLDDASDSRTPSVHGLGGSEHSSATLAQLNALVSDATLDTSSASRPPNGSASGDLSASYPGPTVAGIQGESVSATTPTEGQVLVHTAGTWTPQTPPSGGASLGEVWSFDDSTTMADPGSGNFRMNNTTQGSATLLAISNESETGLDFSNILARLGLDDFIYIQTGDDASEFVLYRVTADAVDNTAWLQVPVSSDNSGSEITDGVECGLVLLFSGSGSGSGDVVGPAGGVVDNEVALYDSTTGKLIKGSSGAVLADFALLAGATFTGNVSIQKATPTFEIFNTSDATDEGRWRVDAGSGRLQIRALSDAGSVTDTPITIFRNGSGVDEIQLDAPFVSFGSADLIAIGSLSMAANNPFFDMQELDQPLNEKGWSLTSRVGSFSVSTLFDSGGIGDPAFQFDRTLTAVDLCTIFCPLQVNGNITLTGTVDGRDVDADGTTLDALATHAATHSDGGSDEITIENLATSGALGEVPTSDGAGGLTMEAPLGGVLLTRYYTAREFLTDASDVAVSGRMAPFADDGTNTAISVVEHVNPASAIRGFGLQLPPIPTGATNMQITLESRPNYSPSGTDVSKMLFYERDETTTVGAWSSSVAMNDISFPDSSTDWVNVTTDNTLATWGVAVGNRHRIDIVSTTVGTSMDGAQYFKGVTITFT